MKHRSYRRPCRIYCIILLASLAFVGSCDQPFSTVEDQGPVTASGLNVLFIGNSLTYTNDLPDMLEQLLSYAGIEVGLVEIIAHPNFGLQDHWLSLSTRQRAGAAGWDVVILQQGPSATEGRPSLLEYTRRFAGLIEAAGARPALYMVWPARSRFFDFDGVSDSYRTAAEGVDGLLFPAGEAWRAAWRRDPDLALYGPDGFHPSPLGTYLAALVIFEQLSDQDASNLPSAILTSSGRIELSDEVAQLLQESAHEANITYAR